MDQRTINTSEICSGGYEDVITKFSEVLNFEENDNSEKIIRFNNYVKEKILIDYTIDLDKYYENKLNNTDLRKRQENYNNEYIQKGIINREIIEAVNEILFDKETLDIFKKSMDAKKNIVYTELI